MLTIRLLGAIEVAVDGEPLPLTPRAVGVLVRLALAAAPKRGTGLSDPVADVPTDDDFVADAIAVLGASGIEQCVLVCASEVGMFGARLTAERPDLIIGVVFINAHTSALTTPDQPERLRSASRWPAGTTCQLPLVKGRAMPLSQQQRRQVQTGGARPSRRSELAVRLLPTLHPSRLELRQPQLQCPMSKRSRPLA